MARCHELGLSVPSACATPFLEMQPARNSFTPFRALKSLKLDMQGVWYTKQSLDVLSMGIDWAQMTDLHLMLDSGHMLTLDECLCLLRQARSLQRCSLNAICLLSSEEQEEVSLDACRDLRLVLQGEVGLEAERSAVAFLSRINAPFLKTFQVEWFVPSPFPWDMEAEQALWAPQHARFLSFLERSGKSLETLRISHLPLAEAQLIQCIAVAKRVENLELKFSLGRDSNDPLSDRFFRRLGDRDVLLPNLRNLKLQCHGKAVTSANLDNLIRKRKLHNVSAFIGTKLSIHPSTSAKWKSRQTSVSLSFFTDF
ncbi:hypothetical protein VNI00_000914 [Paramarasmius palmivorus]|uniref:Uncharacterized protein n=1 Tax=Paramarasmius palmivorus TaxID=297713 RepID=A0AAW0EAN0_9AGAR